MPRLRLTTGQRGYGPEHQKLRKRLLPYAYGTPCPRCGKTMEVGQQLHLGHSDDRRSYTGMEHAECNLKAAVDMRRNAGKPRVHVDTKVQATRKTLRVNVDDL